MSNLDKISQWFYYIYSSKHTHKKMKIIFRGKELELHYSMRIYIIYENIMGKGVAFEELQSYTSLLTLFYSALAATLQYNKMDSNVTYDEFIDWLDEDPSDKLKQFSEWFVSHLLSQSDKTDTKLEKETKSSKGKKQDSKN